MQFLLHIKYKENISLNILIIEQKIQFRKKKAERFKAKYEN